MSLAHFHIRLLLVIASAGCTAKQDRVLEPNDDTTSIATNTYIEPSAKEIERMIPVPHDAELYTNVIKIYMDESGAIMDEGKEITIEDLVDRVRKQPRI